MDESGYPFSKHITKPPVVPPLMAYLAPRWLGIPMIYFAVAVSFLFLIVVFL
jgi:hypothetical protein